MEQTITTSKVKLVESMINFRGKPISYDNYLISKNILNTKARRIVYKAGRQVGKSFTLGSDILAEAMAKAHQNILYVAPSIPQTKAFSTDKIGMRIQESKTFKEIFIDKSCTQNVFEKSFKNQSRIRFKAMSQLESIRGITAEIVEFDEVQDMEVEGIQIIEEVMTAQEDPVSKYFGTAKHMDAFIEVMWKTSNQIHPILICPAAKCKKHQIPWLENIKPDCLRCRYCNEPMSVREPYIYLKAFKPDVEGTAGYWIPQIVLPLHVENPTKWADLYYKFITLPPERFLNEVMGISTGSGVAPITKEDLRACCEPSVPMSLLTPENPNISHIYAGIDWGLNKSFTVIHIGGWDRYFNRFTHWFFNKYISPDPAKIPVMLADICNHFGVQTIVADRGSGYHANGVLQEHARGRVVEIQYVNSRQWLYRDERANCWNMSRTKSLINTFKAIKARKMHWTQWSAPNGMGFMDIAPQYLAEYAEVSEDRWGNEQIMFQHSPDNPDDALQADNIMLNWCLHAEGAKPYLVGV